MTMIDVGSVVVCIYGGWRIPAGITIDVPRQGGVYTVRGVTYRECFDHTYILLQEVRNRVIGAWEPEFDIDNFRPAKKTDISLFEEQLKRIPTQNEIELAHLVRDFDAVTHTLKQDGLL